MSQTGGAGRDGGGISLGFETGTARAMAAQPPFRLLIVGDFGGDRIESAANGLSIQGEIGGNLPAQLGVRLSFEVENLLGSPGAALAIDLPIQRLGDFSPKALSASVPILKQAAALRAAVAAGQSDLSGFAGLDQLQAAVVSYAPPAPSALPPQSAAPAGDLDRLLSMIDGGDAPVAPPRPDPLAPLVGAIVQSTQGGRRLPTATALAALDTLIARQAAAIRNHPRLREVEANWKALQLLLRRPAYGEGIRVDLLDLHVHDAGGALFSDVVPDELESAGRPRLGAILLLGQHTLDGASIADLAMAAAAGLALRVPVIASLAATAADALEHDQFWAVLRHEPSAAWLCVAAGDLVLDATDRDEPLWGDAGWAVACQIVASATRTGWPAAIVGPAAGEVDGFDVHEVEGRAGPTAWPLRRVADVAAMARQGVLHLAAQPNRDRVSIALAPVAAADDAGHAGEEGLAERLMEAALRARLEVARPALAARDGAEQVTGLLEGLFAGGAPDADVRVMPAETAASLRIEVRPGRAILPGVRISFDWPG